MAGKLEKKIKDWEKRQKQKYSHDVVDPQERKKSQFYADWLDHGILRYRWHNFAEVAPGFYRSNHPNHKRFEKYAAMGIKTIVNLRGPTHQAQYYFEVESCKELGLELINLRMSARKSPPKELLLDVMDTLDALDKPTLIHCKSGADRTGLVSAIYLLHVLGRPVKEAQKMLSIRFVHLNFTQTGILDYVIDQYAKRCAQSEIPFRTWVETEFDTEAARVGFKELGFWKRIKL